VPLLPPTGMLDEVLLRLARTRAESGEGAGNGAANAGEPGADGRGGGEDGPAGGGALSLSGKVALASAAAVALVLFAGAWLLSGVETGTGARTIGAFPLSIVTTSPIPPGVSLVPFYTVAEEPAAEVTAAADASPSAPTTQTVTVRPGLLLRRPLLWRFTLPATSTGNVVK
jgi:hypothetical protein